MNYYFIKTTQKDFVYRITLARAEKRNAFTPAMVNEIAHAIAIANSNPQVKLVVFDAEGPVFCAGMDLQTFQNPALDRPNPAIEQQAISLGEVMNQLLKPSLAIIEGDAIAGAFLLFANCTYVYCLRTVRFRLPELAIGLFPFQVMASLLKVMTEKKMLQLCLNTEYFSSTRAQEYGLVDGFLEDLNLDKFIAGFKDLSSTALRAGIQAAKELPTVPVVDRYQFLLASLAALRKAEAHDSKKEQR